MSKRDGSARFATKVLAKAFRVEKLRDARVHGHLVSRVRSHNMYKGYPIRYLISYYHPAYAPDVLDKVTVEQGK